MDILFVLFDGILIALQPMNLGLAILGVVIGLFVGAMPGLGSVNGVAILLPFTFVIQGISGDATSPMIFLAAVYYGAMYGGAISSVALGIPGASTAVATTFDGRPLALQGKAHIALMAAALASFAGATVSNMMFTGFAPMLASVALDFGNPEIFALMLLAFATFAGLGGDDFPKTIFSICFGLALSAVGFDIISGEPRLIFFDIQGFSHGIRFLVLAIGIYGISEMLWTMNASRGKSSMSRVEVSFASMTNALIRFREAWRGTLIGSVIGFFVGILPAAGATPASLMAYGVTKMTSRDGDAYGKGAIDGVAAPGVVIELYGREHGDFLGALLEGGSIFCYGQAQSHVGFKADSGRMFVLQDALNNDNSAKALKAVNVKLKAIAERDWRAKHPKPTKCPWPDCGIPFAQLGPHEIHFDHQALTRHGRNYYCMPCNTEGQALYDAKGPKRAGEIIVAAALHTSFKGCCITVPLAPDS